MFKTADWTQPQLGGMLSEIIEKEEHLCKFNDEEKYAYAYHTLTNVERARVRHTHAQTAFQQALIQICTSTDTSYCRPTHLFLRHTLVLLACNHYPWLSLYLSRRVAEAKRVAANINKGLREEDSEQPRVIDYIRLKAEVSELESKQLDWVRRLEIADLEEKKRTSTAQPSDP